MKKDELYVGAIIKFSEQSDSYIYEITDIKEKRNTISMICMGKDINNLEKDSDVVYDIGYNYTVEVAILVKPRWEYQNKISKTYDV